MKNSFEYKGIKVEWLNHHASFLIIAPDKRRIIIDPWEIKENEADIVLVTHDHYDHFNADDIRKISSTRTTIIAPASCKSHLNIGTFKASRVGARFNEDGIVIEAVPAYNFKRFRSPGEPFHPKLHGNGYIIDIGGIHIYHASDTDLIDEIKQLRNIDIALLPCGGTYTMDSKEAAQAANIINPAIAVPMHWGKIVGNQKDAENFAENFKGETRILE